MSKYELSSERLDTEFDHFLLDMKPYVLKHPSKTERQRCAQWIKKLCDPATCGSGLIGRKNRNMYARLLLQMLKRGVLDGPFTSKPEPGSLKTLPAYMSIYFDEPLSCLRVEHGVRSLPDWVTGELSGCSDDSLTMDLLKDKPSSTPVKDHHRRRPYEDRAASRPVSSSPLRQSPRQVTRMVDGEPNHMSPDDSDLEARLNSWNLGIEKPRYLREEPVPLSPIFKSSFGGKSNLASDQGAQLLQSKETEMKIKVLEAKHQEEKLKMQQRHDAEVEKLHAAVTEMEQEKFELQKKHTQNIQELLEDTNVRLAKMESDYNARSQATEQTMRELELRVKQQSAEVEKGNTLRQKVTQEKAELEIHIASISTELQEANRRIMILQKEKEELSEQHEQATQKLQVKYETDLSHLHHEHALSAAKASEVMADLEKTVAQIKQQLEDSEHRRHQQVRDQEMKVQQEKDELLISCEKKVLALQTEAEKEKAEAKRKIAKLEEALREKESQLDRARESQRQHIQQADMALEQFKKQVELSSEKAYADMKLQMEKVEEDLKRSRSLREKQAKEFSQQLDDLRQKFEQQMAEQRMQHEQERTRLQQQHSAEKDSLVQEHQREVSSLERQARAALQQHQQHTQEWRKRDAQTIADLEAQLSELREELKKAHAQHKQQLAEMALLQEEEKQRATLDKRASLDRLERNHQQEKDAAHEKGSVKPLLCLIKTPHLWATTNSRLKQIEREYSQKLAKSAQLIAELQTSVCDSKEEAIRLQTAMEKQLKEANARWEEERKTITHRADQAHKALQEKVESLQRQLHSAEKNLLSKELETEEKVTMVHKEYEEKIKGLMPVELRQELEDTISSLKAQVNFLQMRASLLQEDLDACRSSR
ncbi:centrosomal protein of 112 kDa isoform X7 [Pelmatolapia mariae]|uniref:centrosomal protein of 112 kDa isoform X7 n=1 Tax=Pelmatolapia mariae TaxID=158779 RepID=UPI002FE5EE65